jgi:WD40 repeat protein
LTDQELDVIKFSLQSLVSKPLSLQSIRYLPQRTDLATFLSGKLDGRTVSDIHNFLEDLPDFEEERSQHQLSLVRDDFLAQQRRRDRRLNALRLDREMNGRFAVGAPMTQRNLQTEALKDLSDSMGHTLARFGQCSGDVATMAWVSDRSILCGATSTMDDRTLDHNKQGNLVLYSAATEKLEVFKDHREPRPTREGENRDFSRDKWLYPSVVASTIDPARHLVYTAAFDKTVKVWNTKGNAGSSMDVVGTWPHEGKVNFVAAAQNGSGLVATAADVSPEAVRVYAINMQDPSASQYISLSCPRRDDQGSDEWAYWPATLQWGTAEGTRHLLAVGYSPRSRDGDENQIPEDKQRTGAILLWDSQTGRVIPVHANTVANVFEVVWHPTLPQLIVATSRSGLHVEKGVRTQIRIWKQDPDRMETDQGWHEYKTLDCTAEDINELTVMPNSSHHTYITASCTSGEIFVWDTARGDRPIHVLRHGPSIEPFESEEDMKRRDVGVKFTAWGHTPDRLFTGSSDGKVNLWNVRKKDPFIRTVMQGEGAIFCGAFSPDKKILAIGDGPGTVWLLTDPDEHPESWGKVCKKRHIPHVPDVEDTNETSMDDVDDDDYPRQRYLDTQELVYTGIPVVGVVQGPIYQQGIHFDLKSHLNEDKTGPLIPTVERQQQAALRATQRRRRSMRRLRPTAEHSGQAVKLHKENSKKDFDPSKLGKRELEELKRDRVELEASDEDLVYESE